MKYLFYRIPALLAVTAVIAACAMPWSTPAPVANPAGLAIGAPTSPKPATAEGTIQPLSHSKLAFQAAGKVRQIVESGASVRVGDVVVQLDTSDLDLALRAAQDDLAMARAQETLAREGSLPEQASASSAGVRSAQMKLDEVLAGPREAERRAAGAAVEGAAARVQDTLAKQEQLASQPKAADVEAASASLENAERDEEAAVARLAQLEQGATVEDIAQARSVANRTTAELAGADAALRGILAGPPTADIVAAQGQIDQARTRLAQVVDAPRATTQDLANAQLAVEGARALLDKARADAGDVNVVGAGRLLSLQAADAVVRAAEIQVQQAQNTYEKLRESGPSEWDVRLAQQAVAGAQAAYDRVTRPPTAEERARAEAQVNGARAALEGAQARVAQLERGATEADLVAARGTVASAQAGVTAARSRLTQVATGPTEEERRAAAAALEAASHELRSAEARREQLLAGATRAEQEQARSALAAAVAADSQTRRGPTDASLQVASARTQRAETAVEQARAALDRATLRAPFAGTVTSVSVREGEAAAAGAVVATIADLSRLQVETRDLDEGTVARVRDGQDVAVTVTALSRTAMPGRVVRLAAQPQPSTNTTDVYYTATIALTQPHPDLRWGMTARVEFR